MTSVSSHRCNNFDLIRLVAALQVVLSHAIGHTGLRETLPQWGGHLFDLTEWLPGVPIFFVISGFLISRSYERSGNLGNYFWNRTLRIFPALWVCLAVTLVVLGWFGFLPLSFIRSGTFIGWLAGQVSFLQFFNPEQFRGFGIGVANGALWTITVELQFYVFIPLLYAVVYRPARWKKLRVAFFTMLFAASYLVFCVMNVKVNGPGGFSGAPFVFKLLFNTLLPHLWMFLLGILIHRYFATLGRWLEGYFLIYIGLYAIIATVMQMFIPEFSVGFYVALLPARILLALATISAAYSARSLSTTLLRGTDVSYGVYIYHSLMINIFVQMGWISMRILPVILLMTILLAGLSWHLVEKPALACKSVSPRDLLKRRFRKAS